MTSDEFPADTKQTFSLDTEETGEEPALLQSAPWLIAGRYRMGEKIGAGGFGAVWAAEDLLEGGEVAVKMLPALSAREQSRVRHEITALRWLRLPGVVRLLDDGQEDGRTYIVMDRVRGRAFPAMETPARWEDLEPLAVQLLEVLAQVHRAGVVHLDLKPANVLIEDGRCVVLDFGLARGRSLAETFAEGFVGGTPRYASPEQLVGRPEPVSDLFALGVMLYEALTAEVPDDHGAMMEQVERRRHQALPPLEDRGVPERARRLVNQLITHDPRGRPEDAVAALGLLGRTSSQALEPALDARLPAAGALDEVALRDLFKGPDVFMHLREDGARELWARTGGEVTRIRVELAAWVRKGVAHLEEGLVALDRAALDRLAAGLRLVGTMDPPEGPEVGADAAALLGWIRVAWPDTREPLLRQVVVPYIADFEAALAELERAGLVWRLPGGRLGAGAPVQARAGWSARMVFAAHEDIAHALPEGTEGRLRQMIAARIEPALILAELPQVVHRLQLSGREARAIALLDLGIGLARQRRDEAMETRLLLDRVDLALGRESSKAVDRILYELGRCLDPSPGIRAAERLVKGVLLSRRGDVQRALAILEDSGCAPSEALDVWRQGFRTLATSRLGLEAEQALISELYQWAGRDEYRLSRVWGWEANLRYRQERYLEAAQLRQRVAAVSRVARQRISAMCHGAESLLEAGQLEETGLLCVKIIQQSRELRLWDYEARATWVARVAGYRSGQQLKYERELVEGAGAIGGITEGVLVLNEAAIAARVGLRDEAAELAAVASRVFREHQHALALLLTDAMIVSLRRHIVGDVHQMVESAELCPVPEVGVQILGLLALGLNQETLFTRAENLADSRGLTDRERRLDILSINESTGQAPRPW